MEYLAIDEYEGDGPVHLLPYWDDGEWAFTSLCGSMPEGDWAAHNPELSRIFEEMNPEEMCPECLRIRAEQEAAAARVTHVPGGSQGVTGAELEMCRQALYAAWRAAQERDGERCGDPDDWEPKPLR